MCIAPICEAHQEMIWKEFRGLSLTGLERYVKTNIKSRADAMHVPEENG